MLFNKKKREDNETVGQDAGQFQVDTPSEGNYGQSSQGPTLLTREEHRLTRHGRYELDEQTRKLTKNGKTTRLKHRLNVTIVVLIGLIILTYIILIFL